jgi:hypothetical protein
VTPEVLGDRRRVVASTLFLRKLDGLIA